MGSEIKNFSLVFTSVVLSPKHEESEESTGKVWGKKTFQVQVFLPYFGRSRKRYSSQNSKHGNSELAQYGKIMGSHKYSKGFSFLYIPQYSVLLEIETHAIPKTWEITEFSQQGKCMGKHKHSKAMGFLHISCVALIHTIPKI